MAERMVLETVASLRTIGLEPHQLTLLKFMTYAAKLQVMKLSVLGLLRRDQLILDHTACVKKFLKRNPHIANADDYLDAAFCLDVTEYMAWHFIPMHRLLSMTATPGAIERLPDNEYITPAPSSEEAVKCVADLNSVRYSAVKTRLFALEPTSVDDLLREVLLKVDEAARIMRIAPKTLEDMCRDGRIPKSLYARYAKSGTYHFRTAKLLAFVENRNSQTRKGRQ
jgi:hypothetical protein